MNPQRNIRKDDVDALGAMADFVGSYMTDFADKADNEARSKLFKNKFNIKETMLKAIKQPDDIAVQVLPDGMPPMQQAPAAPTQPIEEAKGSYIPPTNPLPPPPHTQQLELNLLDTKIPGSGTVKEAITHFNHRLDKLEQSIIIMNNMLTDIRSRMPNRKTKKPVLLE